MIHFVTNSAKLTSREVDYWKKVFDANLLFASEVEFESGLDRFNYDIARRDIRRSGSLRQYGNGIEDIKGDGSLTKGAEITTAPRRIYGFEQMVNGYKYLIDQLYEYEPYIHARAGWHNHVSLQCIDNIKAQETDIPGVILKNVLTLCKKYYPALAYFSSTLPENQGAYTRYDNYCRHKALMDYDSKNDISRTLSRFNDTRYQCVNMNRLTTNGANVDRFHIEFRFPDCSLFPIQMASFNILIKSLILKAIELSAYGVIDSSIDEDLVKLYNFKNSFNSTDDEGDIRYNSDDFVNEPAKNDRLSAMLYDTDMEKLIKLSKEMVTLLSDEITKIDEKALGFIMNLAVEPISIKFRILETNDVRIVNDSLEELLDLIVTREDESVKEIEKVISLGLIKNTSSKKEWREKLTDLVACKESVVTILNKINKVRKLEYTNQLGFYFK